MRLRVPSVKKGDVLVVLEAMKMENEIQAVRDTAWSLRWLWQRAPRSRPALCWSCCNKRRAEDRTMEAILNFLQQTGFYQMFSRFSETWGNLLMIGISLVLLYLAIAKKFEPLLLVGHCLWHAADEPDGVYPGRGDVPHRAVAAVHARIRSGYRRDPAQRRSSGYPVYRCQDLPVSLPDLHRHRRDDRFRPADREPQEPAARRGGADSAFS